MILQRLLCLLPNACSRLRAHRKQQRGPRCEPKGLQVPVAAIRDENEQQMGSTFAARPDLSGNREKDAFDEECVRKESSRRADLSLQGCYNKRVLLCSSWFSSCWTFYAGKEELRN